MNKYAEILKNHFGFENFRGIQREIIESIGAGHDTLGLMPTGGGKSITFQVPALAMEGICIVITPLIALMKDQVEHLRAKGIKAAAIYMGMTHEKVITTLENCIFGDYKFLYVSPERLKNELFQKKLIHMRVSFVCVDEAHCISQWGYDFRPSYLEIKQIRKIVPHAPILALTATATPEVAKDIQKELEFSEERVYRMSFERKNLAYKVYKVSDKESSLKRILQAREGSTIIYCRNREYCKELAKKTNEWGYTSTYYHAGLNNNEKDDRQNQWQKGNIRIMVATNAFGMGIDKAEVRTVVHMGLPDAIESYFQEAGRAGRDNLFAEAILLYDGNDIRTLKKRVNEYYPDKTIIRNIYDEIGCYLQIAVGFGQGLRREFNIVDFCAKFGHFPTIVESSLKLLTKAGYINYSDSDEPISRLIINVKRDELYLIKSNDQEKAKIIEALLRLYTGLFVNLVPIDEMLISKKTGLTQERIYQVLRTLTQQHILTYIPKKNIPHITYTRWREKKEDVIIPTNIYEKRKTIFQKQIDCMLEYATMDDYCRSRFLLNYFGEKIKKECGQCDICLEKKNTPTLLQTLKSTLSNILTTTKEKEDSEIEIIKKSILNQIETAGGKVHPFALNTAEYDPNHVKQAMKDLMDDELIRMDENLWICLRKKGK
ncbi:MAG: RecQ family ATP-dependent DNA helicase [Bacteroidaceae bacterium]|nr:RecQ family ATP-dependent DNA helicase [Bacteroidaceae bacterium]